MRGYLLGNPQTSVALAIVTDGAPNTCESTVENVVREAKAAYEGDPQILTYVIGLESGYLADMQRIEIDRHAHSYSPRS